MGAPFLTKDSFFLPAILLCVVLLVYYPVLSAGFISIDDLEMLLSLGVSRDNGWWSPIQLFFSSGTDRYYRPFHILSFRLDHLIWQQEAAGYHLTNYLLHGLNSLLFFSILKSLATPFRISIYYALPGALLFALHPLTCESVAWISGRTDLIASLFCFIAFRLYLTNSGMRYLIVPLSMLLGMLAKESALALIPILLLSDIALNYLRQKPIKETIQSLCCWIVAFLPALMGYIFMRTGGIFTLDHGTQTALSNKVASGDGAFLDHISTFLLHFFASIAFYLKKLFIPFPLNFAIDKIAVFPYFLIFLALCILAGYQLYRKKYALPFWGILTVISFFPALFVATSKLAWTPYAERYLYLSCAIWSAAIIWTGTALVRENRIRQSFFQAALWSILAIWGITTFQRTFIWHDDLSLWQETIQQSPDFGKALYKYGEALAGAGHQEAGLQMIRRAADTAENRDFKSLALIYLGKQAVTEKKDNEALQYFQKALAIQPDRQSHEALAQFYNDLAPTDGSDTNFQKALFHYEQVYKLTNDAFYLLLIGKMHLRHNPVEAQKIFLKIIEKHPGSIYAEFARKHLKTINTMKGKEQ
jgi:tetratricopeptide (TPR) repeat protein